MKKQANDFKILIVEDASDWQIIIPDKVKDALCNDESLKITVAKNFHEGHQLLQEGSWHLLITDIGLPPSLNQKLGIHLAEFAHKQNIPTIVISGTEGTSRKDVSYLIETQSCKFFDKEDFDRDSFRLALQTLFEKHISPKTNLKEGLIDFVIITAIEIERKSVCKAFKLTDKNRVKKESRVYWRGAFPINEHEFYDVVVAQSPDMANVDAAILTTEAIHHWHPESMLMVGIAGAASPEENLGDLILGSSVYYYERGKQVSGGSEPEPYMYPSDTTLLGRITSLSEWSANISVERPDRTNNRPKIYAGVIASGERVIADTAIRQEISAGQRKIKAIEMEGYGFSKAVWQSYDRVRHLVIKAICDSADSYKNDEWHLYAATVAADFTKYFLSDRPLDPRNNPPANQI